MFNNVVGLFIEYCPVFSNFSSLTCVKKANLLEISSFEFDTHANFALEDIKSENEASFGIV